MNYFILFANCIPVRGIANSLIMDLQREECTHIPTELFHVLEKLRCLSTEEVLMQLNGHERKTIEEYLNWMIQNDWGMFTSDKKDLQRFSSMNRAWNSSFLITNLILYINKNTIKHANKITNEINHLNIQHCELFLENETYLEMILKKLEFSSLKNIRINIINPIKEYDKNVYEYYCSRYFRISAITIFNCEASIQSDALLDDTVPVWLTPRTFQANECGIISKKYFVSNIKSYTESLHYNSCLNQKITIDAEGNIRNCPCIGDSYGHIGEITLKEVLINNAFKMLWNVRKDQVEVCRDCEFRYVCTDCRAFIEDPENLYSKPLKCGYDPYIGKWEEWSKNPLKQKAMHHYGIKA